MSIPYVIQKRYADYTLDGLSTGQYVNGIWTETKSSSTVKFAILPLTAAELNQFPEGTASLQDIKLYQADGADVPDRSVVTYKGAKYEIRSHIDRDEYKLYIGKKLIK